jgi:hypothetical protein
VHSDKLLGVTINECLIWTEHINSVSKNVSHKLITLKRLKKYLPLQGRKLFYQYYILPIFEYCCTIWGNTQKANLTVLLKLQKRAARLVLNKPYYNKSQDIYTYTSSTAMFRQLKWLPTDYRIKYHFAIFAFKAINNLLPPNICGLFTLCKDKIPHTLRSCKSNNIYQATSNYKSSTLHATKIWNGLSLSLKQSSLQEISKYISTKNS